MKRFSLNVDSAKALAAWQHWLERERRYEELGWNRQSSMDFLMEVSSPIEGNVLEIGAGKGGMTRTLLEQGATVSAVDISEEALTDNLLITTHRGLAEHVTYYLADASALDFSDASFGLIVGCYVLHHLENPEPVLKECVRLLSSQGRILLADFTMDGFKFVDKVHKQEGRSGHSIPEESIILKARDYLREFGFKTQRLGETGLSAVEAVIASRSL
jgi:ubiquinone/menaquinone biosynthesis C-methylase UbiE